MPDLCGILVSYLGAARQKWGHRYLLVIFSVRWVQELYRFALEEDLLTVISRQIGPNTSRSVAIPWWARGGFQAGRRLESLCKAEDQPYGPILEVSEMLRVENAASSEGLRVEQVRKRQVSKWCKVAGLGCSGVCCLRAGHKTRPTRADLDEAASGLD